MQCENLYCIYWADNECVLENITLNIKGICQSCIYAEIEEGILHQRRKQALRKEVGD